jgi:(1->4)-alpha-D-glucan 1-alpha-D-glucosylmutase
MGSNVEHEPRCTYRVQLHAAFGFDGAAAIADYLEQLGVSHLYSSPYLQAARGSTHGYDVVDPHRVNFELGPPEAHEQFCLTLGKHHLGQVLDVVPNHMSIADRNNLWWWDVLENGPSSPYASYFDVEWQPPEARLQNIVLLPVLGDHYGRVLEAGEIRLERTAGAFTVRYHDHAFPLAPRTLDNLLASAADRCRSPILAFIADSFGRLPLSTVTDRASIARRHRDKEVLRGELVRLCQERTEIAQAIDQVVADINAEPDAVDALLSRQNYRLAFWRAAGGELGYRRFFDINTLVSLRMEDQQVFLDTHALILRWLKEGVLDGVRIDHPDGLRDPEEYLLRLREAAPRAWIVVEKILESGERLPPAWPVAGTTGYDFLNLVNGLFVDPAGEKPLTDLYTSFTGRSSDYPALVHETKHLVLRDMFGSDVKRLTALFVEVCEQHRRYRDFTRHELLELLQEAIACFPVYRTYVRPSAGQVSEDDVCYVNEAIEAAKRHRPDVDGDLFHFLRDLLLLRIRGELEFDFVARFQQLTGPVMAKGVEDTVFYDFNRLISLNEVGGDPSRFGLSPEHFHEACGEAQRLWPQAMLASSTHDTKRSEDVRARINLLSEIPPPWFEAVARWTEINERHWQGSPPDRNLEYFFYQTLVGAWPIETERVVAYLQKACREAKSRTSWTKPDQAYETLVRNFAQGVMADEAFRSDLSAFVQPLVEPGWIASLSLSLIKLTAPGVPDIYQGTEIWDRSLVDPDNRRPVDYALRRRLLAEAARVSAEQAWKRADEGLPKIWLIRRALAVRQRHPEAFGAAGTYRPLIASGAMAAHVVAFVRGDGTTGDRLLTVVPRLLVGLKSGWADTRLALPKGEWRNALGGEKLPGESVRVADLLRRFPVALLERGGEAPSEPSA